MDIQIVPVTKNNVEQAITLACKIFNDAAHHDTIRDEFLHTARVKKSYDDDRLLFEQKIMALVDGVPAGLSGHYAYRSNPQDLWLDWTGIDKQFQGIGLGKRIVKSAFQIAHDDSTSPIEQLRIWTWDEPQYDCAHHLYERMGYTKEPYNPSANDGSSLVIVFSQGVNGETKYWADSRYELPEIKQEIPRLNELLAQNNARQMAVA